MAAAIPSDLKVADVPVATLASDFGTEDPTKFSEHVNGSTSPVDSVMSPLSPGDVPVEVEEYDMLIIGAGISGINTAYRFKSAFPKKSYVVLEARANMGGTWDLMRYPGIRSDSDLHTFGFAWRPWSFGNPIAEGGLIVQYLKECAAAEGVDQKIKYKHKLKEARWQSRDQSWTLSVEVTNDNGSTYRKLFRGKFMVLGTGYYDYDTPLQAKIPGLDNFKGRVV
jgi:cation diffusion facilitator CzcD-associated flavoprotein CzcO